MAVTKTAAGTYVCDFRDQDGHRIRKTFDKHKDADNYEKEMLALVAKREYRRPSHLTVGEVAEKWFSRKAGIEQDEQPRKSSYRRASLVDWRNQIKNYITPELGNIKIYDLDIEQVERARDHWGKRVSPKMVNKVLTTLTSVLGMAKQYRWVKDNVGAEAERLKIATEHEGDEVTPDKVYTEAETNALIRATEPETVDRLMVMFPVATGCRIGEALGAAWEHIDLKTGVFRVRLNLADSDKGMPPSPTPAAEDADQQARHQPTGGVGQRVTSLEAKVPKVRDADTGRSDSQFGIRS
jgi:integrase